jgi:hypothetical protein
MSVLQIKVTIPSSSVSATLTDFPLYIDLSTVPVEFWENLYYESGADIRIKDSSHNLIPFDLVYISKLSQKGCLFVKTTISNLSDSFIYISCGDGSSELLPSTDLYGRNAVWSDYHRVFMFGDYLFDRTGSGQKLNYTSTYNDQLTSEILSPDTTCHQGCAFDGTHYYAIGTNLLRKYDTSWNLIIENTDPCSDAGGGVNHCGSGFIMGDLLYIPQTSDGYTVTQLSTFNTSDLSFSSKRSMLAPGGVYWTAGVCYVPEWDKFVFCEYYNDGTKLFMHNNDLSLSYAGSISFESPLTTLQGITYWRGAFWVSRDSDNTICRVNTDGSEITRMFLLSGYTYIEGPTWFGDNLFIVASNSTTHGVISKLSLPLSIEGGFSSLHLNDAITPNHRGVIYSDRFTQWSLGIGQNLVYRKNYQNHVVGYGLSTATDNAKRETLTYHSTYDRYALYNSSDGLLFRDPLSTTISCSYKDAFADMTGGIAPTGWTERWNTTAASILVVSSGVFGYNCLQTTSTTSSKYAVSVDSLGTSVSNCEVLSLIYVSSNLDNIARVHVRGGGSTGAENTYFAYIQPLSNSIGIQKYVTGTSTNIGNTSKTIDATVWYYVRFRVVDTSLKLKVWDKAVEEPASWDLELTDGDLYSGWVGIGRSSVNTAAVLYDYFAVDVNAVPVTVPLPVTDIEKYSRLHIVHDGTTERKLYYNNTVYTDAPCAERPSADADSILIGYNDADYQFGTDGYLSFLYIRSGILSDAWITAENNNLNDPYDFYYAEAVVSNGNSVLVNGDWREVLPRLIWVDGEWRDISSKFVRSGAEWKAIT